MKITRKILSLALALVMTLALCVSALADEKYTITIVGSGTAADHTFEAYQIFAGDLYIPADREETVTQNKILSNIVWGSGVDTTKLIDGKSLTDVFGGKTAAEVAEALEADNTSAAAQDFAKKVAPYLSAATGTSVKNDASGDYTISDLPAGYYLVKDRDNSLSGENDFYTAYIMKVVADVQATPKGQKPTLKKELQNNNNSEWFTDHAGFQLGDTVNFRTISALPSNIDAYDSYTYIINDTMSEGLTSNVRSANDVTIKVSDTTTLEKEYYTVSVDPDNANYFTVSIDVKAAIAAGKLTAEQELYMYYSAILNEKAQFYFITHNPNVLNTNTASLTYSNDPNDDDTGKTPDSTVTIWTFPAIINKIDENSNPLTGARFVVSRNDKLNVSDMTFDENGIPTGDNAEAVKAALIPFHTGGIATYEVAIAAEIAAGTDITYVVEAGTYVSMAGFGEHSYYLYEIKAPAGYNLLSAPVKFTVHSPRDGAPDPKSNPAWLTIGDAETHVTSMEINVVNNSGATLPETGGIGTTIFYAAGALLVVGAGVLLVTKKRMNKSED